MTEKQRNTTHHRGACINREWLRGDRDPVSRTNFNKIHASRFESVIVGETSGKRNFHYQTQIIQESRIPHEINHASHAFRYSRITAPVYVDVRSHPQIDCLKRAFEYVDENALYKFITNTNIVWRQMEEGHWNESVDFLNMNLQAV